MKSCLWRGKRLRYTLCVCVCVHLCADILHTIICKQQIIIFHHKYKIIINVIQGEVQVVEQELTKELAGECLSLLSRTGNGLSHAYVRLDLKNRYVAST